MWYTGKGDGGETSLFFGGRVAKDDPRIEALGALDEASSAIGVARAFAARADAALLIRAGRALSHIMGEVAAPDPGKLAARLEPAAVTALEAEIAALSAPLPPFAGFVVPGDTPAGALLDHARAVTRRAERRVIPLVRDGRVNNPAILAYLNRLSSLLYLLARREDAAAGGSTPVRDA
ncbi:MAG TPA: cob(I)yrinic acid a,c-diamide adenosyltransferase [Armatimonadota bacterium]|nr:cob(I)yrinic acid a,c-diamide adenosyltransferase [Armatimonadota bacterium]HOS42066.1 cob(I)yrinic acid a,c-diamide adenosyltransferase [Armatimonadota bacterium]